MSEYEFSEVSSIASDESSVHELISESSESDYSDDK